LTAIRRFAGLARQMRVTDFYVIATAAPREAANGPEFVKAVEKATGVKVDILSGKDEARLSALGVVSGFREPDGVVGDLGGGSLELVDIKRTGPGLGESFPLGGLRLGAAAGKSLKQRERMVPDV